MVLALLVLGLLAGVNVATAQPDSRDRVVAAPERPPNKQRAYIVRCDCQAVHSRLLMVIQTMDVSIARDKVKMDQLCRKTFADRCMGSVLAMEMD